MICKTLEKQKQLFPDVLQNRFFKFFVYDTRKYLRWSFFNKAASLKAVASNATQAPS